MNWFPLIAGAVIMFLICLGLHTLDIDRIEAHQAKVLADQVTFDIDQCQADKKITKGENDDLHTQIDNLGHQLIAAKLQTGTRCIVPVAKPARLGHSGNTATKLSGQNDGVTSDALFDFAADCEQTRLYLINLRQFDLLTWKEKGQ